MKMQIATELYTLSKTMMDLSRKMEAHWPDKAKEMMGAAKIAHGWYLGIPPRITTLFTRRPADLHNRKKHYNT